jgi:hypothetical protein
LGTAAGALAAGLAAADPAAGLDEAEVAALGWAAGLAGVEAAALAAGLAGGALDGAEVGLVDTDAVPPQAARNSPQVKIKAAPACLKGWRFIGNNGTGSEARPSRQMPKKP